jgi:hypothetical protein
MATGATGQLGLALPVQGELSGTWGDTVNNGITQYTNIAIAGTLTLTGDGAVTLANTTGDASASNITSTLAGAGTVTAQFSTVRVSGTTTTKVVTGPSYSKSYLIDNASSYTVTFKASGQTGVSISPNEKVYVYYNATDYVKVGGGGITYGAVKTTTYTAVANDGVLTDTTGGAFTVNLPATPATGTQVFIADSAGTWGTNNLTIGRNGSTIAGSATDLVCDINSVSIQCIYDGTTWDIFAQIGANDTAVVTLNGTQTLTNKTLTAPTITSPTVTGTGTIAAATVTLSSTLSVTGVSTLTGGAVVQGLTVGRGAGAVATTTAVGASALAANSSGGNNVAIGYQAGLANSTGGQSTLIGSQAGLAGTDLDYVTAVGYQALSSVTSGDFNTALGAQALKSNTSASNNTAVGYQAGYSGTTGGANGGLNVYVGEGAGYNSTGSLNTFVGRRAGYTVTSNEANTFIGYQAGYNTTSANNTFVGLTSGLSVSTGASNSILGAYTGNAGGLDIRTLSNYVVLSDGDGNPIVSSAYNKTVALQGAVPQTGTGITFPATQSASSNANTLDDYEEGTWTPSLGGNTTYNAQTGKYTKIGRNVILGFTLNINTIGTGSTSTISGLPFTVSGNENGLFCTYWESINSSLAYISGNPGDTGTSVVLTGSSGAVANLGYGVNVFKNGARLEGTIHYFTAT